VAELTLAFSENSPCGKEYLACGDPAKRIDVDLSNILYIVRTGSVISPILGNPLSKSYDLHAVLLHETGHFLGLGHLQMKNQPATFPAVMLDTYRPDFCVSIAETMLLNSAAEANWKYRATTCKGLRRPPGTK